VVKKKILSTLFIILLMGSCQIEQIPRPQIYTGNLPQSEISELTLDERIIIEEAWSEIINGNGRKAINKISKINPENPFYTTITAYAYYELNDLQSAEQSFKTAIENNPEMTIARLGLAQLYEKTQRDELAFIEYREILKNEPEHTWAKPRYEEIKRDKTNETLQRAKNLMNKGDLSAGEEAYLKALYYSPESIKAHTELAHLYLDQKKYERANVHLETLLLFQPENKNFLESYAEALFQNEEFKKSFEVYKELKNLDPKNKNTDKRLEQLKNRLGIFDLPSQYDSIPSQETVTREDIAALLGIKFQEQFKNSNKEPPIIIDISTSWASDYILKLTSMDILDVYPNHTFKPKNIVTRAELAEVIYQFINYLKKKGHRLIQQIPAQSIQLPDVSPNNFYYRPIIMSISYGILNTSKGGNFNPENPVSGLEAIKALNILLSLIS
jgi:Tfp pilus assembly protein PilF